MWSHNRTRAFVAAVVAAALASAGCLNPHLNPFPAYPYPYPPYQYPPQPPADKSAPPPVDNHPKGPVVQTQHQVAPPPTVAPPAESTPLPVPTPVPPPTTTPAPAAVPPGQPQTMPLPVAPTPNVRDSATLTGKDLRLRRDEMPIDRALEILQRLDDLIDENKRLQARIRTLEANGLSREHAMNETLREVEKATEEVVKARGDIQGLRAELNALRAKVKQVEDNELDTLKKVIAALEKVLEEK
jgi:hypothetical protein